MTWSLANHGVACSTLYLYSLGKAFSGKILQEMNSGTLTYCLAYWLIVLLYFLHVMISASFW